MTQSNQFCTFYLDRNYFGVAVENVQEVIRYQEMISIPLAEPEVEGLINLRGIIVPAIDLRRRLQMKERDRMKDPKNVVVRAGEEIVSLLVDEIGDVLEVKGSSFEPPPETLEGIARELVCGVFKLKDRILLILDIKKTVNIKTVIGHSLPQKGF